MNLSTYVIIFIRSLARDLEVVRAYRLTSEDGHCVHLRPTTENACKQWNSNLCNKRAFYASV